LKLAEAHETLKDEKTRQSYDLAYLSIKKGNKSAQNTGTPRSTYTSNQKTECLNEAEQIAVLQRSKEQRSARWRTKKNTFDSTIFELQREIRRLEQDVRNLEDISTAERAEEAKKNSWSAWLLSPIYRTVEDSEQQKARKDRARQERRIEKDIKERRLEIKKTNLEKTETLLRKEEKEINEANLIDNRKIREIQNKIWTRKQKERDEVEEKEREERLAKEREQREEMERRRVEILKHQQQQREKREREAAEALRKQQAEQRAAEQKRMNEEIKRWRVFVNDCMEKQWKQHADSSFPEESPYYTYPSVCDHDGWWPKLQGYRPCPTCDEI
jgi:hypothetical protein